MKNRRVLLVLSLLALSLGSAHALTIYGDNFDGTTSTITGWKRSSSSYIQKYTGSFKIGTASMRVSKNYNALTYINVAPFKSMVLKFKMAAYSMESGEYLVCEYQLNSGSWVQGAKLANGSDNGVFRSYSVNIPNANVVAIRFRMVSNSTADYGYIDEVELTGLRK